MSNDPLNLNIDLAGVQTAMPVLPAGKHPFVVDNAEVKPGKEDPTKRNLVVTFALAAVVSLADGTNINPGYKLTKFYPLQQSDNPKAPDFKRDIAVLFDAVYDTDESTRPPLTGETVMGMFGKPVLVNVTVEQDPTYGTQNRVGRISKVA
jgi:hypothetical protein